MQIIETDHDIASCHVRVPAPDRSHWRLHLLVMNDKCESFWLTPKDEIVEVVIGKA